MKVLSNKLKNLMARQAAQGGIYMYGAWVIHKNLMSKQVIKGHRYMHG